MSASKLVAAPIVIRIKEKEAHLPPLTLFEIGRCEIDYRRYRFRELKAEFEIEDVPIDGQSVRKDALRDKLSDLADDITPVLEWLVLTLEGRITGIKYCLDSLYPCVYSLRDVAEWMNSRKIDATDPITEWLIASGVLSDPTIPASPGQTVPTDQPVQVKAG